MLLVAVAVPVPLRRTFDYSVPERWCGRLQPGMRVQVGFGRRQLIGVVAAAPRPAGADDRHDYRPVAAVLDETPLIPEALLELARWAADYYLHPIGEVFAACLPTALRQREQLGPDFARECLRLTASGTEAIATLPKRAHRQRELLEALRSGPQLRNAIEVSAAVLRSARESGWIETCIAPDAADAAPPAGASAPLLNGAQQLALQTIESSLASGPVLLQGVTGSGKTELYLRLSARALERGQQTLVLAPEIGLTPQLAERYAERFGARVGCYHSGLGEAERARTWLGARNGTLDIVVGTRSAVFLPLQRPGLIVVDEEHDASYKQPESFRYSARDVAVLRAQRLGIPIVLGSATPSLESLANAAAGRYRHIRLDQRVHGGAPPRIATVDLRQQTLDHGLSEPLLRTAAQHLDAGGQVLLFQNRRGYAPTLLCHSCGWSAPCRNCDARMVMYRSRRRLLCHHCGATTPVPAGCPDCGSIDLVPVGQGTERIEEALRRRFPRYRVERFDSDRLGRAGELQRLLTDVRSGAIKVLVGTQVLAKGHDFSGLSFAGIVDVDQALYGSDFRALERMGQLLTQVAGRVGRAGQPGEVLLQTHQPQHPLLRLLVEQGYDAFAAAVREDRQRSGLPPYAYLGLLRAEAPHEGTALSFLQQARAQLVMIDTGVVDVLGPAPAGMERRAGNFRAQLLLRSASRAALHRVLRAWLPILEALPVLRALRWSLDVDPVDLF
jgi:primosomal protein N' (replication factor Y)